MFRTRAIAAATVEAGRVRVNGMRTTKPGRLVRPGDTLTVARSSEVLVTRILALGLRRGSATEAALLRTDLDPPR